MHGEQLTPVVASPPRLPTTVEIRCLLGPFDGQVDLVDLFESACSVGEPGRDRPVTGVSDDVRLDVVVEYGETLLVPLDGEPVMRVRTVPPLTRVRAGPEAGLDVGQPCAVRRDAAVPKRRRVAGHVEGEEVAFLVELELRHPVHQLGRRHVSCGGDGWV